MQELETMEKSDMKEQEEEYKIPPFGLINYEPIPEEVRAWREEEVRKMQAVLMDTFEAFRVAVKPAGIERSSDVTRYRFVLPVGKSMLNVTRLKNDIMAATQNFRVNILAPIPGTTSFGVELENIEREDVNFRELLLSSDFANPLLRLPVILGKDVVGKPFIVDMTEMGHLLIGSTIGMGKSVCINDILLSFLYKFSPTELKFILLDLKNIEMDVYKTLPHLGMPIAKDPSSAVRCLKLIAREMEHRYDMFRREGVTHVEAYNRRVYERHLTAGKTGRVTNCSPQDESSLGEKLHHLPYIIVVINELTEIMMQAKDEVEALLDNVAINAPAAGIYLVATTQSPQRRVVTESVRRAFPSRIALRVNEKRESRILLDADGAENLVEHGDALYRGTEMNCGMTRFRSAIVSFDEISNVVRFCSCQRTQHFIDHACDPAIRHREGGSSKSEEAVLDETLYDRCVRFVILEQKASTSLLQRRFSIDYGCAAKMMDMMEERGVISSPVRAGRIRKVIIRQQ